MLRWGLCEFGRRREGCTDSLDHLTNVSFGQFGDWVREREGGVHIHSDSPIIAGAREHARVGGIPCHGVDTACSVPFECFDKAAVFFVPYVDFGICFLV